MNFFICESSPELIQANTTPKMPKLNALISFDRDKLPTKIINNYLNNKFHTNITLINPREIQNKLINNNSNIKENEKNKIKLFSQNENIDLNNLCKSINEEKSKADKPLITNHNTTWSISEILFKKPAPLHFTKSKHFSKSCSRLEIEKIKDKINEKIDKENLIEKSNTDFLNVHKNLKLEKSFDAYSNCDFDLRNIKGKINLEDDFNETEKEAYGFTNEISRNFKGEMKFNLLEIDNFLNNENGNYNNNNNKNKGKNKSVNGKLSNEQIDYNNTNNSKNVDNQSIEEAINKEMKLIKKMSAELRRNDTLLSTSEIQDKNGPPFFSESDLLTEIIMIKSQVIIIFL